ncbi:IS66 family insertion sequence element accessory protein TnpB [Mesorhizobium sp. BR1-1-12]|uniref:IS66 family insertion sequence element accessory protein TnpB n=1 Tax=unclassified Mesorhizobium TaxID=325217 RepID=UPI001CCAE44A|nr:MULTISPECIES: IS66 family insertion sequence element accessory protein TnpB [unclassified Mesorhizobium]MBZ9919995.1 IS66 family insertion sequence element accessory protein TnpB [Mesorhizobium sp. BR1-1-7]MBZ9970977.1 IS66 family insertion sequence element accessory protein TnpB [Mesorhizobium sp. BR1-1-12]
MIGPTGAVKVMVAMKPVDFRKGCGGIGGASTRDDGRRSVQRRRLRFRAKRTDRIQLIFWDGTGVCLYAKRLEDGEFRWPKVHDGMMRLTATQLPALLEGLDWRRVHEARQTRVPAQAG